VPGSLPGHKQENSKHVETMPIVVAKKLDCCGKIMALLIIALYRAIHELHASQIIEVISDNPVAPVDLASWCRMAGHELLEVHERDRVFSILIRKSG